MVSLTVSDLSALSCLLDDALNLAGPQREAWLAALPLHQQHLAPALSQMLQEYDDTRSGRLLSDSPSLPSPSVARVGDLVGPYRLLRPIGQGGMGSVWLAERTDGGLKRQVAVKLPRLAWDAGLAARMARERDIGALLEHAHIARLYDAGVDAQGRPFLVMQYIDGQPIDAWCRAQGLSTVQRLRLFVQVARAVAYAHGRLVVHRDLKPSNILVTADGQVHLLDFGIAKLLLEDAHGHPPLTSQQGVAMTPHYAAPEQIAGAVVTVQSDVYSLGVLLYELLTGVLPTQSSAPGRHPTVLDDEAPLASRRAQDPAAARALRGPVDAILAKSLQLDPVRRYGTADALATDIERHLDGLPVSARPDTLLDQLRKQWRRHRTATAAVAMALVTVLAGGGATLYFKQRAAQAAAHERAAQAFVSELFRPGAQARAGASGLLGRSADLIDTRFADQPTQRLHLYAAVAEAYRELGDTTQTLALQFRRWQALPPTTASAERQAAALALAEAQMADGQAKDAQATLQQHADAAQMATRLLRAGLLAELGDFEQLKSLMQALDAELPPDGPQRARWTAVQAETLHRDGRMEEAVTAFTRAAELADAAGDRQAAAGYRASGAHWAAQRGSLPIAQQLHALSQQTLQALGGRFLIRAAFDQADYWSQLRAQPSVSFEQADAGINDALIQLRTHGDVVPPRLLARVERDLGLRRVDHGDLPGGASLLRGACETLLAIEQRPLHRAFLHEALARLDTLAGRHEAAEQRLLASLSDRQRSGRGLHPYVVNTYLRLALNASMAGWTARALAHLDSAPTDDAMRQAGHDPSWYRSVLTKARARVLLDAGQIGASLALLQSQAPHRYDRELAGVPIGRDWLRGEALCAGGQARRGLALLRQQWQVLTADRDARDPGIARLSAVSGLCARRAGDAEAARRWARQADSALAANPELSGYFRAPLDALSAKL